MKATLHTGKLDFARLWRTICYPIMNNNRCRSNSGLQRLKNCRNDRGLVTGVVETEYLVPIAEGC